MLNWWETMRQPPRFKYILLALEDLKAFHGIIILNYTQFRTTDLTY